MKTFVIDRTRWVRGGRGGDTRMLNFQGNMCCLGQVARQCGFSADQLYDRSTPVDVVVDADTKPSGFLTRATRYGPKGTRLARAAIIINDAWGLSDCEREARLSRLFKAHGYALKFKGGTYPNGEIK